MPVPVNNIYGYWCMNTSCSVLKGESKWKTLTVSTKCGSQEVSHCKMYSYTNAVDNMKGVLREPNDHTYFQESIKCSDSISQPHLHQMRKVNTITKSIPEWKCVREKWQNETPHKSEFITRSVLFE